MPSIRPFTVAVPESTLARIAARVREFRWDLLPDAGGWSCGTDKNFMRELATHWLDRFDWRAQESRLNQLPQFVADVDGIDIHFFHLKGKAGSRPLLLVHGWPGSAFEFFDLAPRLAWPERFGDSDAESFDVVIPCLPGYGFSGAPAQPIGPRRIAALFDKLMTDVLGYRHYLAQGGDWGSAIASWLGFDCGARCRGVHLNMTFMQPSRAPAGAAEIEWAQRFAANLQRESAYAQLQGTKPQTLAYAMTDNPVGVAAWIVEKFAAWSDLPADAEGAPDLLAVYSFDQLLTNIMFYVANDNFATSTWLYYGLMSGIEPRTFPAGERCATPTGFAAFADPVFPPMPRSFAAEIYNIVHWSDMPRGGHFAALEQPQLLLDDLRAFARGIDTDQSNR